MLKQADPRSQQKQQHNDLSVAQSGTNIQSLSPRWENGYGRSQIEVLKIADVPHPPCS